MEFHNNTHDNIMNDAASSGNSISSSLDDDHPFQAFVQELMQQWPSSSTDFCNILPVSAHGSQSFNEAAVHLNTMNEEIRNTISQSASVIDDDTEPNYLDISNLSILALCDDDDDDRCEDSESSEVSELPNHPSQNSKPSLEGRVHGNTSSEPISHNPPPKSNRHKQTLE